MINEDCEYLLSFKLTKVEISFLLQSFHRELHLEDLEERMLTLSAFAECKEDSMIIGERSAKLGKSWDSSSCCLFFNSL